jgi:hypothetical protein
MWYWSARFWGYRIERSLFNPGRRRSGALAGMSPHLGVKKGVTEYARGAPQKGVRRNEKWTG